MFQKLRFPSVDRFGKHFGGLDNLGEVKSAAKVLLISSTENGETQLLKGKKCQPQLQCRTLMRRVGRTRRAAEENVVMVVVHAVGRAQTSLL